MASCNQGIEAIEHGVTDGEKGPDTNGTNALKAWSLVHGCSTLILDGKLPKPGNDHAMAAVTQIIARTCLEGLIVH